MTSSIIDIMTAGLVAIREEFYPQVGIEKFFVVIGAMNFAVAEDTVQFGPQAAVLDAMPRWSLMALPAESTSRLDEKSVIGRTVRLMAFGTAAAVNQMLVGDGMFISKGPCLFRMAILAGPVQSDGQGRIIHTLEFMAVGAADVSGFERMNGAPFELGRDGCMTGSAKILAVIFDQAAVLVIVDSMARKTGHVRPIMRIGRDDSSLMCIGMASAANFRLFDQRQARKTGDVFCRWIINMLFPSFMATNTTYLNGGLKSLIGRHLVRGTNQRSRHIIMAIEAFG
jgi:hypothetical protein